MPWCDTCDVYLAPNSVEAEGTCPTCHETVDTSDRVAQTDNPVPWHFWVVVVALVAYLGWRLIEGVGWVVERF
jgi:hypothetical protein